MSHTIIALKAAHVSPSSTYPVHKPRRYAFLATLALAIALFGSGYAGLGRTHSICRCFGKDWL